MVDFYLAMFAVIAFFLFLLYLGIDFLLTKNGANPFLNKWAKKTVWIWLPFYALQRLIKEVILGQK